MAQTVTTVEVVGKTVYGEIIAEVKNVSCDKVQNLLNGGWAEYEIFNATMEGAGFNTITYVVDGEPVTIQIGEHDYEVQYNEKVNQFVISFSINTNTNVEILNNAKIKPIEMVVMGTIPIDEDEAEYYGSMNDLEYIVVQEIDGKELLINTSVEVEILTTDFQL